MSGLVKAKKYDWKDSNMALVGSDKDKQVRKESAQTEAAWTHAGEAVGLRIWRIVQFKVQDWPKGDYGKFFSGDSYIVLNTYHPTPDSDALCYDVHFWIGTYSTQDEYGTAAYKTVELDALLDDRAVQHREVQDHESTLFRSYFKQITLMEGGADTGFNHVEAEKYVPRLLLYSGKGTNIKVKEVPICRDRLSSGDVFLLDMGLSIIQWNGSSSSPFERNKAAQYLAKLKGERMGKATGEAVDEGDIKDDHEFYAALTGDDEEDEDETDDSGTKKLLRVSDEDGSLDCDLVTEGEFSISDLDSKDVFLVDLGVQLFVWVGKGASQSEKANGMAYATSYLKDTTHPLIPISVESEDNTSKDFKKAMGA